MRVRVGVRVGRAGLLEGARTSGGELHAIKSHRHCPWTARGRPIHGGMDGPWKVAWTVHGRWHGRFMEGYHVLGAAGVARVELREPLARREDLARVDLDVGGLGQGGWAGKGVGATERGQGGCG